jgi:putative membrane protein
MNTHRAWMAGALLASASALAQAPPQPSNPSGPAGSSSSTSLPSASGSSTTTGASPGRMPAAPPVSSAAGTTPDATAVLAELHHANKVEIDLGHVAESRASNSEVKKFAKHMIKAHTDMDRKGQDFAKKNHLTLSAAHMPQDAEHQTEMKEQSETKQKLQSLRGAAFDKAYMQEMADGHAKVLQKVEAFESQATDDDLKSFLGDARKEVAEHKRQADDLVRKLGATAQK